jgi:hypothetical protein
MANVVAAARVTSGPTAERLAVTEERVLQWLLRVACAAEFVGHGAFGIITKAAWVPYFSVVGISPELGWKLMPAIGSLDISLGLLTLLRPTQPVLLYMAFWGLLTATIRPLAGEPIWEFVERVPNWAVPLAYFAVRDGHVLRRTHLDWLLRLAVAGALVGHGAYGAVLARPAWLDYFGVLGVPAVQAHRLIPLVGTAEMVVGVVVLLVPVPGLLLVVAAWKIGTELLRPLAAEPFWEFVERASNMLAPIGLLYVRGRPTSRSGWFRLAARPGGQQLPQASHTPDRSHRTSPKAASSSGSM